MLKGILNKPMTTNFDLKKYADELNIPLKGIYSKDELKRCYPLPGAYIINMANSYENGTHWVALFLFSKISKSAKQISEQRTAIYFDSFGVVPPIYVIDFCERFGVKNISYSQKYIQEIRGGFCGQYCLLFLYQMSRKPLKWTFDQWFKYFLNYFGSQNFPRSSSKF